MIAPMFKKLLNASGDDIVKTMPPELIDWFRDTTLVMVKHNGKVEGYQFESAPQLPESVKCECPEEKKCPTPKVIQLPPKIIIKEVEVVKIKEV